MKRLYSLFSSFPLSHCWIESVANMIQNQPKKEKSEFRRKRGKGWPWQYIFFFFLVTVDNRKKVVSCIEQCRGDGQVVQLLVWIIYLSTCQQIWKTQQWPQDWKRSVFTPIPKKGNAKECSNYCTIALISHTSKTSNAQNSPSQASTICEPWTSRRINWF